MVKKIEKTQKINKEFIAKNYIKFKLGFKGIITQEIEKSLGFELLTDSMLKLGITSAIMANHKTKKENSEYNYNFWEFKVPENYGDFLICVLFENQDEEYKINGYFIFPKNLINSIGEKGTINIFESDISGMYTREPKINKHQYFKNYTLLLK